MMEKDATIMTPVTTEYSPDANGRYGLLTCNETCSTHPSTENPHRAISLSIYLPGDMISAT